MRDPLTSAPREFDNPREGDVIDGRYRVQKVIGRGGMSCIVRAQQLTLQRDVAIKLLHAHVAEDAATLTRFEREVHLAKSLVHPNIIQYYDYGTLENGSMYLVMELLNGFDLHALIRREGTLGLHRAIDITMQVLDGLTEAHAKSVIHRDLKPRNLFMQELNRRGDFVKILDFGIAKSMSPGESELTKTGVVCGTPSYLAPELLITQKVSPASDLYSVGLVFLEMLTGRRAFKADTMARTFFMQLRHPVPIPAGFQGTPLEDFLLHALAKHPDDRFQNAHDMIDALQELRRQFPDDVRLDPDDIDSLVDSGASQAPGMSALDNLGLEILRDPAWTDAPAPIPVRVEDDEPTMLADFGDDEPTSLADWNPETVPSRAALRQSARHRHHSGAQPAAPHLAGPPASRQPAPAPSDRPLGARGEPAFQVEAPALGPGPGLRTKTPQRTEEMQRVDRNDAAPKSVPKSRARLLLAGGLALALLAALALTFSANLWNDSRRTDAPVGISGVNTASAAATTSGDEHKPAPDFTFVNRLDEPAKPAVKPTLELAKPPLEEPIQAKPAPDDPDAAPDDPAQAEPAPKKAEPAPPKASSPAKVQPRKTSPRKPAARKSTPQKPARKKPATSVDDIMNNNTIFGDE